MTTATYDGKNITLTVGGMKLDPLEVSFKYSPRNLMPKIVMRPVIMHDEDGSLLPVPRHFVFGLLYDGGAAICFEARAVYNVATGVNEPEGGGTTVYVEEVACMTEAHSRASDYNARERGDR